MDMVKIPDTSDISQCEMTTASIGGDNKPVSVAGVNPPLRYTLSCTMLHWSIVARANAKRGSVCEQYMKRILGVRIFYAARQEYGAFLLRLHKEETTWNQVI